MRQRYGGDRTKFVRVQNSAQTCGSTDCKRRWRQKDGTGRFSAPKQASGYQGSQESNLRKEMPVAQALFCAIQTPKKWRQITGSPLTPNQFHCATVADGPADGQWKGGDHERIEARNRAALREHFRKQAAECLIQPHHSPVNILGGYRFPNAPKLELPPLAEPTPARVAGSSHTIPDDLSIPDFLKVTGGGERHLAGQSLLAQAKGEE